MRRFHDKHPGVKLDNTNRQLLIDIKNELLESINLDIDIVDDSIVEYLFKKSFTKKFFNSNLFFLK